MTKLFGLLIVALLTSLTSAAQINEIQPNPVGSDPTDVQVELIGSPGASFDGFLIGIENDGVNGVINNSGSDDDIEPISGIFDANGLLTVTINDLENPSFTLILTDAFTGFNEDGGSVDDSQTPNLGTPTDIDANDDGIVDDLTDFGNILDALGTADSEADLLVNYAAQLGGTTLGFTGGEPEMVFRDGTSGDFIQLDNGLVFDQAGNEIVGARVLGDPLADLTDGNFNTFGAPNPTVVPEPQAAGLALLAGIVVVAIGRRRR